eukprot:6477022-Prymnesium_polylepis.1
MIARAVRGQQRARVLEPLADHGVHLGDAVVRLHEPLREEDAAVGGRQLVVLPLAQVVVVLEPLVLLLANVLLVQPPRAVVDWLHLVGLALGHLPCLESAARWRSWGWGGREGACAEGACAEGARAEGERAEGACVGRERAQER